MLRSGAGRENARKFKPFLPSKVIVDMAVNEYKRFSQLGPSRVKTVSAITDPTELILESLSVHGLVIHTEQSKRFLYHSIRNFISMTLYFLDGMNHKTRQPRLQSRIKLWYLPFPLKMERLQNKTKPTLLS